MDLNKFADKLAHYLIRQSAWPEGDRDVLRYGLILLINGISSLGAIFVMAWPAGVLAEALIGALCGSLLRIFSGGYHFSSSFRCAVTGGLVFTLIGYGGIKGEEYFSKNMAYIILFALFFIGWFIIWKYAPKDTPNRVISSQLERQRFKLKSMVIFSILMALLTTAGHWELMGARYFWSGTLGISWQLFSITPVGYRLLERVDGLLSGFSRQRRGNCV